MNDYYVFEYVLRVRTVSTPASQPASSIVGRVRWSEGITGLDAMPMLSISGRRLALERATRGVL